MMKYFLKSNHDMSEIEDDSIDCIVGSPPYNWQKNYGGVYNDKKPMDEYIEELAASAREIYRVLSPDGGTFWLNIGDSLEDLLKSHAVVEKAFLPAGFFLKQRIIWHRFNGRPSSIICTFKNNYEFVFLFTKDKNVKPRIDKYLIGVPPSARYGLDPRYRGVMEERKEKYGSVVVDRGSVWSLFSTPKGDFSYKGDEEFHEAEFPVELPYLCIRCSCFGDRKFRVLDPWLGTGTTFLAARIAMSLPYTHEGKERLLDLDVYGYEINPAFERNIKKKMSMPIPGLRFPGDGVRRLKSW